MTSLNSKSSGRKLSDQIEPADLPQNRWRWPQIICVSGLMLILLLQMLVPYTPDPYWDMDPRSNVFAGSSRQITEITAPGMITMNLLAIGLSFIGLLAHKLSGGKLRTWVLVPVSLGSLAAMWVGVNAEEAIRASAWAAAAMSAGAIWHLVQTPRERNLVIWSLMGICVLLGIRAALYAFVEFPATLKMLMENREALFQARGWAADSSQAQAYIRRASQMEAGGAIGLSNVFGSLSAALAFISAGIAVSAYRSAGIRRAALPAAAFLAALLCLALSQSKGAFIGMMGVTCFALLAAAVCKLVPNRPKWLIPALAIAVLASGFLLVIFRGAILGPPPTIEGERSLLFRYHYWTATANMIGQISPAQLITGVSPDGFRDLYPKLKVPINPEEVSSNHNYWIDYFIMLGLGGLSWAILMTGLVLRAITRAYENITIPAQDNHITPAAGLTAAHIDRVSLRIGGVFALLLFFTVYSYQKNLLLPESLLALMFGLGVMAVAIGMGTTPLWINNQSANSTRIGLALAGLVLLFHGQIEMTFVTVGATTLGWVILAVAAADWEPWATTPDQAQPDPLKPTGDVAAKPSSPAVANASRGWLALLPVLAVVIAASGWFVIRGLPILQQQRLLAQSATIFPQDFSRGMLDLAKAVQAYPANPRAVRNVIDYCAEAAEMTKATGNKAAALSWIQFAQESTRVVPSELMRTGFLLRPLSRLRYTEYQISADPAALAESILLLKQARDKSPFDRTLTEDLGRLYEAAGDKKSALGCYESAIVLSDQAYLDETRVMTSQQRATIEEKISRLKDELERVE